MSKHIIVNYKFKKPLWVSCLFKTVHHQQGLSHCSWVGAAKTHIHTQNHTLSQSQAGTRQVHGQGKFSLPKQTHTNTLVMFKTEKPQATHKCHNQIHYCNSLHPQQSQDSTDTNMLKLRTSGKYQSEIPCDVEGDLENISPKHRSHNVYFS